MLLRPIIKLKNKKQCQLTLNISYNYINAVIYTILTIYNTKELRQVQLPTK